MFESKLSGIQIVFSFKTSLIHPNKINSVTYLLNIGNNKPYSKKVFLSSIVLREIIHELF